jgi:hypothetical protein
MGIFSTRNSDGASGGDSPTDTICTADMARIKSGAGAAYRAMSMEEATRHAADGEPQRRAAREGRN